MTQSSHIKNMKHLLLSEKWRPKKIEDMVLLPRIKSMFETGLNQNVILYGSFGTGKTTLARILIGKWSKSSAYLELNSSFYTSIDVLRGKIDDFCSKVHMGFDLGEDYSSDSIKYVFLDEFERTSSLYQDALKAYIEEYSTKNVRFIFTTNHINKVSPGIRSRLIEVNFDCQNKEEEKTLKNIFFKRLRDEICPTENLQLSKEDLIRIINSKFPDFRSVLIHLDKIKNGGSVDSSTSNYDIKFKEDFYKFILDNNNTYETIYHFVMDNFGPDRIPIMISLLGRPFTEWLVSKKITSEKLFSINYVVTDYGKNFDSCTDPIILGMTIIGKVRDIYF